MTHANKIASWWSHMSLRAVVALAGVAALVILLVYLEGGLGAHKVAPGVVPVATAGRGPASEVRVEQREVEDWVDWPATVTSRQVANLAPKLMARILEVRVDVGSVVKQGEIVVVLDDRDVRTRVQQAEGALRSLEALATQADVELRRAQLLFQKQVGTRQDLDAADARSKSTRAQVAQSSDGLAEAQVMLSETSMRAPFDGIVAARLADPGDMAVPGKPIAIIHDPSALRLEANVSEACARSLAVGTPLPVRIAAEELVARIEEISPASDAQSRTLLVKAALTAGPHLRPGLFASVRLACGTHTALLVPAGAIVRSGQLESVRVRVDGEMRLRSVRTGKAYGDQVEVLSGLQAGSTVLVEP